MTVQQLYWSRQESRLDKVGITLISPKIRKSFIFGLLCPHLKRNSVRLMGYFCFLFLFKSFFWGKIFEWRWTTKGIKSWYLTLVFSVDQGPGLGLWAALRGGCLSCPYPGRQASAGRSIKELMNTLQVLPQWGLQWAATGTWGGLG